MAAATRSAVPSSKSRDITVAVRGVFGSSKPQRATAQGWPHELVSTRRSPANGGLTTASNCMNHACMASIARRRRREACTSSMAGMNHAWRKVFGHASSACQESVSSLLLRVISSNAAAPSATIGSVSGPASTFGGATSTSVAPASRSASSTGRYLLPASPSNHAGT